jgi:hypothetical protein
LGGKARAGAYLSALGAMMKYAWLCGGGWLRAAQVETNWFS